VVLVVVVLVVVVVVVDVVVVLVVLHLAGQVVDGLGGMRRLCGKYVVRVELVVLEVVKTQPLSVGACVVVFGSGGNSIHRRNFALHTTNYTLFESTLQSVVLQDEKVDGLMFLSSPD